jgi:sec-independent protein translocase protein TatA
MGFISAPGPLELLVILAVALIVLGPARLPEAARSVGRGMREMRESLQGIGDDDEDDHYAADELDEERPAAKPVP